MESPKPAETPAKTETDALACEMPPSWVRVSLVVSLMMVLLSVPILMVVSLNKTGALAQMATEHPQAMLGVPWAGGAALIVVLVLRTSFGPVEFKILGTQFRGASGPIVMWVLCFLAEVLAIKVLW